MNKYLCFKTKCGENWVFDLRCMPFLKKSSFPLNPSSRMAVLQKLAGPLPFKY